VAVKRDKELDRRSLKEWKLKNQNASGFVKGILYELKQESDQRVSMESLLDTEKIIKVVEESTAGHFRRNAYIYLCNAVKQIRGKEDLVEKALEQYRQERRKVDSFRQGHGQGMYMLG